MESMADGGDKRGPNWERIARRRIATSLQMFYDEEVATYHHNITREIENGGDPLDDFWTMVGRFDEYADRVADELLSTGHLDSNDPKVQLHSSAYYIQDRFLDLGRAMQDGNVDDRIRGDAFEAARESLAQAESLVDELEADYRGRPTEEEHQDQLECIARRHPVEDDDE